MGIRADAGDAARVSLFFRSGCLCTYTIFVHRRPHAFLVRLPSILLGYSDSSDTTCHVHGSATCVCILLVLRVLSEGGGTSPSSNVRRVVFPCFFCRVVQGHQVSRHRCAEGSWSCAAPNTLRSGTFYTP